MAKQKAERKAPEKEPITISVSDARIRLSELVNRAGYGSERFVIMHRGKRIAALIGAREAPEALDGAA
jgi:prevent-host-death family protein